MKGTCHSHRSQWNTDQHPAVCVCRYHEVRNTCIYTKIRHCRKDYLLYQLWQFLSHNNSFWVGFRGWAFFFTIPMPVAVNSFILPSSTCHTCTISHSFSQEFQALGILIPSSIAASQLLWKFSLSFFKSSASCNYSNSNIVLFNWSFAIVKLVSGMGMGSMTYLYLANAATWLVAIA